MERPKILPSDLLRVGWCQGSYALTKSDKLCSPRSRLAMKWDIVGAFNRIINNPSFNKDWSVILNTFKKYIPDQYVSNWNDDKSRTKEEVITLARKIEEELGWRIKDEVK